MSFQELVGFLQSPSSEISRIALENILPITPTSAGQSHLFKENDYQGLKALKKLGLQSEDPWTIQNAVIALVNLTDDAAIRSELASDSKAVAGFTQFLVLSPKPAYVKYVSMLLNNLSKDIETLTAIRGALLLTVALTTAKPANFSSEDYDFVVFAMAEFARQDSPVIAKLLPHLYVQLASDSLNRRKAVAATIKNCLFDVNVHGPLASDTPLIEAIMIRLKGPEPMDPEDFAKLPSAVRKESGDSKQREQDSHLILLLVESLLLFSSSQIGRDMLRQKHTYFIIRELHKATKDANITMACENFANMIMRGDPSTASSEKNSMIASTDGNDEEDGIQEVV